MNWVMLVFVLAFGFALVVSVASVVIWWVARRAQRDIEAAGWKVRG